MHYTYEKYIRQAGKILLMIGIGWNLFQLLYIGIVPTNQLILCDEYTRSGLAILQAGNLVLWAACLAAWSFPAGKHLKYISLGVGGIGIFLFHLMWNNYTSCGRFSWMHSQGDVFFVVYPCVLWIMWGMFIPYLEKRLRKLWTYGYVAACALMYLIHLVRTPNY